MGGPLNADPDLPDAEAPGTQHPERSRPPKEDGPPVAEGPAINPPSHGDPTNPVQPRT